MAKKAIDSGTQTRKNKVLEMNIDFGQMSVGPKSALAMARSVPGISELEVSKL